jgi:hypothetical protein
MFLYDLAVMLSISTAQPLTASKTINKTDKKTPQDDFDRCTNTDYTALSADSSELIFNKK